MNTDTGSKSRTTVISRKESRQDYICHYKRESLDPSLSIFCSSYLVGAFVGVMTSPPLLLLHLSIGLSLTSLDRFRIFKSHMSAALQIMTINITHSILHSWRFIKQDSIPVGCIPPTLILYML